MFNIKTSFSIILELLGFVGVLFYFHSYVAERKGVEHNPIILNGAKMYRDDKGIPHIQADNIYDGFFALGFAHAEDRLWQMVLNVKIASGELTEIFGDLALDIDKFSRIVNYKNKCKDGLAALSEDMRKQNKFYSNGINHYIKTTTVFPLEFKLLGIKDFVWEEHFSCLGGKLIEYYLSVDYMQELIRTFLHENLKLDKDLVNKMFPFNYEHFEYTSNIIKENEMLNLKYKSTKLSDIEPITVQIPLDQLSESSKAAKETTNSSGFSSEILDLDSEDDNKNNNDSNDNIRNNNEDVFNPNENLSSHTLSKGSNNFVIAGKHTKSGKPILCNDPHLLNGIPGFWYMTHLKIGNEYDLAGATHPGLPVFFIGTNGYVSWGITNGFVDTSDVLKVKRTEKEGEFLLDGKRIQMRKRIEKIFLNSAKDKFEETVIWESAYGPVMNGFMASFYKSHHNFNLEPEDQDKFYYILNANFLENRFANGFSDFFLKKDYKSFRSALKDISISLSLVYIDREGNIGYQSTGFLPKLSYKEQGGYVKFIQKSSEINTEKIPFEEMPHLINPDRGFIVTANNHIVDDKYMHRLNGGFMIDTRSKAIENAIESYINIGQKIDEKIVMDKLLNIVNDPFCSIMLPLVFSTLEKDENYSKIMNGSSEANYNKRVLLGKFLNLKSSKFNCDMKGESREALIFGVFEKFLVEDLNYHVYTKETENVNTEIKDNSRKNIIHNLCRENYLLYKMRLYESDPSQCQKDYKKSCLEFYLSIVHKTFEYIQDKLTQNEKYWKWKNLIKKSFAHKPFSMIKFLNVLSHRVIETEGNGRTPRVAYYRVTGDFEAVVSSNYKMVVTPEKNGMRALISIDVGQNGKIFNKNYDNLLSTHENANLNIVDFENKANLEHTLHFAKGQA